MFAGDVVYRSLLLVCNVRVFVTTELQNLKYIFIPGIVDCCLWSSAAKCPQNYTSSLLSLIDAAQLTPAHTVQSSSSSSSRATIITASTTISYLAMIKLSRQSNMLASDNELQSRHCQSNIFVVSNIFHSVCDNVNHSQVQCWDRWYSVPDDCKILWCNNHWTGLINDQPLSQMKQDTQQGKFLSSLLIRDSRRGQKIIWKNTLQGSA